MIGNVPSDERELAQIAGWPIASFKYMFLSIEVVILAFVLLSFFKYRIRPKYALLVILIPILSFFVGALFGVFVIERYVFPEQFRIQFS